MNGILYVLVADKNRARLYRTVAPFGQLQLVYHQGLLGGAQPGASTDAELARSMCRFLRLERHAGKYTQLVIIGTEGMLAALRMHYDGDWDTVEMGYIASLPPRFVDEDVAAYVRHMLP